MLLAAAGCGCRATAALAAAALQASRLEAHVHGVHMVWVAPALECAASRGAALVRIRAVELDAVPHQLVERGRLHLVGRGHMQTGDGVVAVPAGFSPPVVAAWRASMSDYVVQTSRQQQQAEAWRTRRESSLC
jgi:hypothetical protein